MLLREEDFALGAVHGATGERGAAV
jgi:hypothetical protein